MLDEQGARQSGAMTSTPDHKTDWFHELDLDPDSHPVAMRTRALGDRPWLVSDGQRQADLALKAQLLSERRDAVLWTTDRAVKAGQALVDLVGAKAQTNMHPLETAARSTQEDLALLHRRDDRWYLDASCVCFPTRWHLRAKVDMPIGEVHGPVGGYADRVADKVTRLFDRLGDRPVWRRNWFLMTDPTLHQPDRPPVEPIVAADDVADALYIRSERQTLRQVAPGWLVFTIRIQQRRLGELLTDGERVARFVDWTRNVSGDFGHRRHLTDAQRCEILSAYPSHRPEQGAK